MYSVNVANMNIPITIFICFSISSAQSTESNSSLLETKVEGGYEVGSVFDLKYTGFLILRGDTILGTLTYINERNCITSRDLVAQVAGNKEDYRALPPTYTEQEKYRIHDVFFSWGNELVVAWYGILKLERPCVDESRYITFVNPRLPTFDMERKYYAGGWGTDQNAPGLRYLRMKLKPFSKCKEVITSVYKAVVHNLACATTKSGLFHKIEVGTPLFSSSNELLGIAIRLGVQHLKHTIFALVYNDVEFIEGFINTIPETRRGGSVGKSPMQTDSTDLELTRVVNTQNILDMSNVHAGHLGKRKGKGKASVESTRTPFESTSAMDTQYYHDMGTAYASHPGSHHQYNMGNYFSGYEGPQHMTELDNIIGNSQPLRPINTEISQSFNAHQFPDGSLTALPYRRALENFNALQRTGVLDTARLPTTNPPASLRRKGSRRKR